MMLSSNWMNRFFVLSFVSLALVFVIVSGAYTGLRYGKRGSGGETTGRLSQRSGNGIRSIEARSGNERRFYQGTRYAGKRGYWQPTQFITSDGDIGGPPLPLSAIPYECVYIPFVGVRCTRPDESVWSKNGDGNEDEGQQQIQSMSPPGSGPNLVNENGGGGIEA